MASSARALARNGVRRNGGWSGWKTRLGCGSKVSTAHGAPVSRAIRPASPMTAWWPRCTPSKLPMAMAAPRASSGSVW